MIHRTTGVHQAQLDGGDEDRRKDPEMADRAADKPVGLAIGAVPAANLVEGIWLELADDVELVIHAMALRPMFYDLLPTGEDPTP